MHKAIIRVKDPESVKVTLEITASVKTLIRVRDAVKEDIQDHWDNDLSEVLNALRDCVNTVEKDFVGIASSETTQ
ncbi:hypothetical protein [Ruegeria sp. HKCCD6109]|uniref:hypothetical protein n=1 Tax=Ruegeria sp. HKCCD6109 TaxID=2683017 RepID=UPI0014909E96|nr:hypothetical protein [Ruegeria sp. HKCCD6109]NOD65774.1 hypothetical protein [Ruegeria sp. HKCCD6109]